MTLRALEQGGNQRHHNDESMTLVNRSGRGGRVCSVDRLWPCFELREVLMDLRPAPQLDRPVQELPLLRLAIMLDHLPDAGVPFVLSLRSMPITL